MRVRAVDLVDVLVYLVVLGVFTQLFPQVIAESFLLALLTAALLKLVLEVVLRAKTAMVGRVRNAPGLGGRIVGIATLLLVMPGSKFLVLKLTELVFGGAVQLGGFFAVTGLIVVLMLSRAGVRFLVQRPDRSDRAR